MDVNRFITWHMKLKKQQRLSVKILMRWDVFVANTMFNLYHGRFQEVREVECLEAKLVKDGIVYRESI